MVIERTGRLWAANRELRRESTERVRAEEQLEKSDARLREAQQVARIGFWEWDIERDHVWWSDELYATFGLDRESFGSSYASFLERVHAEDRDRVHRTVGMAVQNKEPFSMEHRIIRPDGQTVTLQGRGRVLTDESGKPTRMLGTAQDISEHKRANGEHEGLMREQTARREAEEANRRKDEFLAVLSHELRNPLNAIVVWAELLKSGRLDRSRKARGIDVIKRSAELQSQLILDLLDLSRITSGRIDLRHQPVDLASVTIAAVDSLRPTAQARDIRLLVRVDTDRRFTLGDPERLQQVLWNLLSNAIRFAPDGGRVRIMLRSIDSDVRISVEDNGPGIDPKLLPHIFDRFRRDGPPARRSEGLGLGLTIVKHLVELHGGSVGAANAEGGSGAVFTLLLPVLPPRASAGESGTAGVEQPDVSVNGPAAAALRDLRVLIVEDDPNSREPLRLLLANHGAEVVAAESCAQALELFAARPADVLIGDIGMPTADGYELVTRIRALPRERGGNVPAIALTAFASAEDGRKALASGYQAHVAKPFDSRELVKLIADLVHGVTA